MFNHSENSTWNPAKQWVFDDTDNPYAMRLMMPTALNGMVVLMTESFEETRRDCGVLGALLGARLGVLQVVKGSRFASRDSSSGARRADACWICNLAQKLALGMEAEIPMGVMGQGWGASMVLEAAAACSRVKAAVLIDGGLEVAEADFDAAMAPTLFIAHGMETSRDEFLETLVASMRCEARMKMSAWGDEGRMAAEWFGKHLIKK